MIRRTLVTLALIGLGWAAAMAQTQAVPDFELRVTMEGNEATIECVRGCGLQWIERIVPNPDRAKKVFTYGCGNGWPGGCPSGRLGGWIIPR